MVTKLYRKLNSQSNSGLTSTLHVEAWLSTHGYGLAEGNEDPILPILQNISNHAWIFLPLDQESYQDFENEWKWVTERLDDNQRFKFLSALWRARDMGGSHAISQQQSLISQFFKTDFTIYTLEFSSEKENFAYGKLFASEKINVSHDPSITPTRAPLDDRNFLELIAEDTRGIYIVALPGKEYRLITKMEQIHLQAFKLAQKLVDQLVQFHILRSAVEERNIFLDLPSILSGPETTDKLNVLVRQAAECLEYSELWKTIFPNGCINEYIIKTIEELGRVLPLSENDTIRLSLIQAFTNELYFPLRAIILKEKEKQEEIALEAMLRAERRKKQSILLQKKIADTAEKVRLMEESIQSATADSKILKEQASKKEQLLHNMKAEMVKMEEQKALNEFLNDISDPFAGDIANITKALMNLGSMETMSTSEVVSKLCKICNFSKTKKTYLPQLNARASKNNSADRRLIQDCLQYVTSTPCLEMDESSGDIDISGDNVIVSGVLPKIRQYLESRYVRQVKFACRGTFILDESLKNEFFHGVNIIIIAQTALVAEHNLHVDVSGLNAASHKESKASNASNFGAPGSNGAHGFNGEHSGDVHIEIITEFRNSENLTVICQGGSGSDGQEGGDGHCGRDGGDGDDGKVEMNWATSFAVSDYCRIERGKNGERGQKGGEGGCGGNGGAGGLGGKYVLSVNDKIHNPIYENSHGSCGATKAHGKPGQDGLDGIKGKDHGWACASGFQSWIETKGYNITSKEEYRFWYVCGYTLRTGDTPVRPARTRNKSIAKMSQQIQVQTQKNSISASAVELVKQIVMSHRQQLTGKNQLASKETHVEQKVKEGIASASGDVSGIQDKVTKSMQTIERMHNEKIALQARNSASKQENQMLLQDIIAANNMKEEAEKNAKALEQMALSAKDAQDGALQMTAQVQSQMRQDVETATTTLSTKGGLSLGDEVTKSISTASEENVDSAFGKSLLLTWCINFS